MVSASDAPDCPKCGIKMELGIVEEDRGRFFRRRSSKVAWVCSKYPACESVVDITEEEPDKPLSRREQPKTVEEAVDRLLSDFTEDQKEELRGVDNAIALHFGIGMYIRNNFGLWSGNGKLMKSCQEESGQKYPLQPDDASGVILEALLQKVK